MRMFVLAPALALTALSGPAAAAEPAASKGQHHCVREAIAQRQSQPWNRGAPRVDNRPSNRVVPLDRLPPAAVTKTVLCRMPYDVRDAIPAKEPLRSPPRR